MPADWRAPPIGLEVEQTLANEIDGETFLRVWAHASVRLVDWAIRHHSHDVEHWVALSHRHL